MFAGVKETVCARNSEHRLSTAIGETINFMV